MELLLRVVQTCLQLGNFFAQRVWPEYCHKPVALARPSQMFSFGQHGLQAPAGIQCQYNHSIHAKCNRTCVHVQCMNACTHPDSFRVIHGLQYITDGRQSESGMIGYIYQRLLVFAD